MMGLVKPRPLRLKQGMNAGTSNIISDARAAVQRRDGAMAQRLLAELPESEMPWLLLAQACNLIGDASGEEAA